MSSEDIFSAAEEQGQAMDLPYAGALSPQAAYQLHCAKTAVIVDVRTSAELAFVGRIPDCTAIEWQSYPDMSINENFIGDLQKTVSRDTAVLFICRSGVRSHHAATAAAAADYRAYNILEGFEGDLNSNKHRNRTNGWRARGLPWIQS